MSSVGEILSFGGSMASVCPCPLCKLSITWLLVMAVLMCAEGWTNQSVLMNGRFAKATECCIDWQPLLPIKGYHEQVQHPLVDCPFFACCAVISFCSLQQF